jgi:hypothetical protein
MMMRNSDNALSGREIGDAIGTVRAQTHDESNLPAAQRRSGYLDMQVGLGWTRRICRSTSYPDAVIDEHSGTLHFDAPHAYLGPATTRAEFLASELCRDAEIAVANEPFCSWKMSVRAGGRTFGMVVYFKGESLWMISLADADPRFGTSWSGWSKSKQLELKASHDALLSGILGKRRRFAWGEVSSAFEERDGASSIVVRYSADRDAGAG